jgi:LuxR family glucitol operon transcriptional activator
MRVKYSRITMSTDHFGKLLTQGLRSVAALEKMELTDLQHDLGRDIGVSVWTIYKWRKGTSIPNDDRTLSMLAEVCVRRGRMDRQWLIDFLARTIYSNKQALIDQLCPENAAIPVTHNLPRRQHTKLIGRERELAEIQKFLSPHHRVGVVCISGGGGVGKTALALEIAHACYEDSANLPPDERFEAIVWVTAKNVELLAAGQVKRQPTFTDVDGIYRAIADLLDIPVIFRTATHAEKNIIVTRLLAEKRILLMLDNLEDVDDPELMVFLRDLPAPSKAIVTTRHRIDVAVPIYLHTLDEKTAHELVRMESERHDLFLSEDQIKTLLHRTGGLPLAIIRTIGRMAWRGSNIETELRHLDDPKNDIYDFCFGKTIALIQRGDAYPLLMSLALFVTEVSREALGFVAGFDDDLLRRDEGLSDLEVLSLCQKSRDRVGLEPLTRTQALSELHQRPDFEAEARKRWREWYLDFTNCYGGRDGQEMHLRYDYLESDWDNIMALIRWCIHERLYDDVVALWCNLRDFTHIYGFWADRLTLLEWIIKEAEQRGQWQTAVQVMFDKAFTLTLTGPSTRLEEADSLLQRCWSLREYATPVLQAKVAALTASLHIKQGKHAEAHQWLDTGEDLLRTSGLEALELARERMSLLFDRGENWFVMGDYAKAQATFQEMLEQGQISGWQRSIAYAQDWLAYTAILQNNPELSQDYLWAGWSVASRIKEKRLIAFFTRTFAYYYHAIGERRQALKWAKEALDIFERLGMPPDIRQMQDLIAGLQAG